MKLNNNNNNNNILLSLLLVLAALSLSLSQEVKITWFDCPLFTNVQVHDNTTDSVTVLPDGSLFSTRGPHTIKDANDNEEHEHFLDQLDSFSENIANPTNAFIPSNSRKRIPSYMKKAILSKGIYPKAQCAQVFVPMSPDSPINIEVFVKRISPESQPGSEKKASKAVWLLMGGPGGSSDFLEPQAALMYNHFEGDLEVYYVEHRGVGRSSRMSCVGPQAETNGSVGGVKITREETPDCIAYVKDHYKETSQYFTTTYAAMDLSILIKATKSDKDVYIYGLSYGTYWASRFMQFNGSSDLVKGVILDGVVQQAGSKRTTIDRWDELMDQVGDLMMSKYCAMDEICNEKLNGNPKQFVADTFEKLFKNGTCQSITNSTESTLTAEKLRYVLGTMLIEEVSRNYIPALLFRLNRCDPDKDINVLLHITKTLSIIASQSESDCTPLSSPILQNNIVFSELWNTVRSLEELSRIYNTTHFATNVAVENHDFALSWPKYPADQYFNKTFSTNVPVLLLNGDIDPQTPLEYATAQYHNIIGAKKELVVIPYAPHYSALNSKVNNSDIDCGMQIILDFIKNPEGNLDKSCLNYLKSLQFSGTSNDFNKFLFGVSDLFDGIYEPPEPEQTVSLYLFIAVVAALFVVGVVMICGLAYYMFKLRDQVKELKEAQNQFDEGGYGQNY